MMLCRRTIQSYRLTNHLMALRLHLRGRTEDWRLRRGVGKCDSIFWQVNLVKGIRTSLVETSTFQWDDVAYDDIRDNSQSSASGTRKGSEEQQLRPTNTITTFSVLRPSALSTFKANGVLTYSPQSHTAPCPHQIVHPPLMQMPSVRRCYIVFRIAVCSRIPANV